MCVCAVGDPNHPSDPRDRSDVPGARMLRGLGSLFSGGPGGAGGPGDLAGGRVPVQVDVQGDEGRMLIEVRCFLFVNNQ